MSKFIELRDLILGLKKSKNVVEKVVGESKKLETFHFRELKAMNILAPYLPDGYLFETAFSLSFQTIQHVLNDIIIYQPKTILEFGSGFSTLVLDKFISKEKLDTRIISVDDNFVWQQKLYSKTSNVDFFNFDLINNNHYSFEKSGFWFDIPIDHKINEMNFDLVIVDAPMGNICKYARFGFIPFLSNKINSDTIVFIDDVNREDEFKLIEFLMNDFPFYRDFRVFEKYARISSKNDFFTNPS